MTVTSLKPIPAGQEILNYYGPLSNSELLRRYGYVTPAHARYDVVEISWNMVLSVLKEGLKLDEAKWGQAVRVMTGRERGGCLAKYSMRAATDAPPSR